MEKVKNQLAKFFKDDKKAKKSKWNIQKAFPYILILTALIGITASFVLTIEHIALLKDPSHQLSCSMNPIINCGPIMTSDQATAFGFPNPIIGIATFSAQLLLGLVMLAGARMKTWFWKLYSLSVVGGILFTFWLMFESIFQIEALCIYCISTWIAMFTVAWYLFLFMLAEGHIKFKNKKVVNFMRQHHADILIGWFAIIVILILHEFWYYYGKYFGF